MVKGKGDEWEERTDGIMQILRTVCLKCTPPRIHPYSFPLIYLSLQMARDYSTQRRNRQHSMSCVSTRCTPSSYLPPQLPTAPSTVQLHRHATRFHSHTNQTHSTVTASSSLRGGTAGGKLRSYETASMRKHGARHGSTTSNLASIMEGAKQARRNSTFHSYRTKVSRHAVFHFLLSLHWPIDHNSRRHFHHSTIQHRNKPSSRRTTTRTRDAPIATLGVFSAVPSTPPLRQLLASSDH
jgi:hypothetical protein